MNATTSLGVMVQNPAVEAPATVVTQAAGQTVNGLVQTSAAPAQQAGSAAQNGGFVSSVMDSAHVGSWGQYFEAIAILCFVIATLWLVLWLIKRRSPHFGGGSAAMRIESRLALGPKKWVVITRYMDKRLVLGVTDQQINLLTTLDVPADEGGKPLQLATGKNFASVLRETSENTAS